ncbi:MAG: hypothetical protein CMJ29_01715 [Phycisphaerae bacterium]|nr:hypothetical protein [Phycisphaerae bacterium]MAT80346.1 hypothetical protein [Phycisphaerae bacterium]
MQSRDDQSSQPSNRAEAYLAPETLSQLSPFELRARMIVEGVRSGLHRSPHQGMAVEFNQHRGYVPGDDLRHLDWKVYGRSDRLTIKQYQQETNLDVILLVDASASMRFGSLPIKKGWGETEASRATGSWTKFDHAVATSVALSWLSLQQSDRVGLVVFGDGIKGMVQRSSGQGQWRRIVSALNTRPVDDGTNLTKTTDQVLGRISNRAVFILVSDLLTDPEEIQSSLARFRHQRQDVLCLQVLDHREIAFDFQGPEQFHGLEIDHRVKVDPRSIRDAYLKAFNRHIDEISSICTQFGYDHLLMNTHDSVGPAVARLLARRSMWLKRHKAG